MDEWKNEQVTNKWKNGWMREWRLLETYLSAILRNVTCITLIYACVVQYQPQEDRELLQYIH